MKKPLFKKSIGLLAMVVTLFACSEKQESEPSVRVQNEQHVNSSALNDNDFEVLDCIWIDRGGPLPEKSCDCFSNNGNCLPEVVVTPSQNPAYKKFKDAVLDGVTSKFFRSPDASELFSDLEGSSYLTRLQDDDVVVIASPSSEEEGNVLFYHAVTKQNLAEVTSLFDCEAKKNDPADYHQCQVALFMKLYESKVLIATLQLDPSEL
jgi:hypothetical protein